MKVQQEQLTTAKPLYGRIRECPGPQSNKSWTTGFVTLGALSLALATAAWALSERLAASRLRKSLRMSRALLQATVGERDALLSAGREALLVWGRDRAMTLSYGGSEALLDSCLTGEDSADLTSALSGLRDHGTPFAISVRDRHGRRVNVRARAVGSMAAVWLAPEVTAVTATHSFLPVLDALPFPVWLRDRKLSLIWANRAFLSAIGNATLASVRTEQTAIEKGERILLVDDLIATGGTVIAAVSLIEKLGGEIVECAFIIDLISLGGRERLAAKGHQMFALCEFEGD